MRQRLIWNFLALLTSPIKYDEPQLDLGRYAAELGEAGYIAMNFILYRGGLGCILQLERRV
jgi:hypothetical protein